MNKLLVALLAGLFATSVFAQAPAPAAPVAPVAPTTQAAKADVKEVKAVEVGNIFSLGTKFSEALGLHYIDEKNDKKN